MRGHLARYRYDCFVWVSMFNEAVGPEVWFPGADKQEMLEDLFEFGLFDPVGLVLLFDLKHVLVIFCNLYTAYSE